MIVVMPSTIPSVLSASLFLVGVSNISPILAECCQHFSTARLKTKQFKCNQIFNLLLVCRSPVCQICVQLISLTFMLSLRDSFADPHLAKPP